MTTSDVAPNHCITCKSESLKAEEPEWIQLSKYEKDVKPTGAVACSTRCLYIGLKRFRKEGSAAFVDTE